jgi:hypothetical protein
MAKLLFGSPDVRINVEKAWRILRKPEVIHGSSSERKSFIAKVKQKLKIDDFLRGSNRKTTSGIHRYWNFPLWVIQPKRPKIMSSPNDLPLEAPTFWDGDMCPDYLNQMFNDRFQEQVEKAESKAEDFEVKYNPDSFLMRTLALSMHPPPKYQTEGPDGMRDLNLKDILESYSRKPKNKDEELQRLALHISNNRGVKGPPKTPEKQNPEENS